MGDDFYTGTHIEHYRCKSVQLIQCYFVHSPGPLGSQLIAALNGIAAELGRNPARGILSMINCGNGEIIFYKIMLR